jgi:class 3 adenylate cyclase
MLIMCILAGKCEQERFLGRSSGRWKDDDNKRDPRLRIGVRQGPVVGSYEHIMGSLL